MSCVSFCSVVWERNSCHCHEKKRRHVSNRTLHRRMKGIEMRTRHTPASYFSILVRYGFLQQQMNDTKLRVSNCESINQSLGTFSSTKFSELLFGLGFMGKNTILFLASCRNESKNLRALLKHFPKSGTKITTKSLGENGSKH